MNKKELAKLFNVYNVLKSRIASEDEALSKGLKIDKSKSLTGEQREYFKKLTEKLRSEAGKIRENMARGKMSINPKSGEFVITKPVEKLSTNEFKPVISGQELVDKKAHLTKPTRGEHLLNELNKLERKDKAIVEDIATGRMDRDLGEAARDTVARNRAVIDPAGTLDNRLLRYQDMKVKGNSSKFPIDKGFEYNIKDAAKEVSTKSRQLALEDRNMKNILNKSLSKAAEKDDLKAVKRILALISKGSKAAVEEGLPMLTKGALKYGTFGAMEGFDAERGGDEPGSLGHMIESGEYSGNNLNALKTVGDYDPQEGLDKTNYAMFDQLKLDRDFKRTMDENPSLRALGRTIASEEKVQKDSLMNMLGEKPTEDIIDSETEDQKKLNDLLNRLND